jgi:hypothetical protein
MRENIRLEKAAFISGTVSTAEENYSDAYWLKNEDNTATVYESGCVYQLKTEDIAALNERKASYEADFAGWDFSIPVAILENGSLQDLEENPEITIFWEGHTKTILNCKNKTVFSRNAFDCRENSELKVSDIISDFHSFYFGKIDNDVVEILQKWLEEK